MTSTVTPTTASKDPAAPERTVNTDWHAIFDSLLDEHDYVVDEIDGALPADLIGTLYRNGPGKNEIGGTRFAHLFDGDGMLSQLTFDGKAIHYRNRFVRTEHYLAERSATAPKMRGFGTQKPGGPLRNAFRMPGNVANTSITFHAGNLLALWEGGRPWRLDPDTLDTVGEYDYDGALKGGYAFSAHPKIDPATGELFNFGIQYGPRTRIRSYRVGAAGELRELEPVTLPYPVMNHDFALTDKHLVFVIDPVIVRLPRFMLGFAGYDGALKWDPSKSTRVLLVPRDGGKPRVAECDPFFHFHINNAFEQGGDTIVDLVRYEDFSLDDSLRDFGNADFAERGLLTRLRVSASGAIEQQRLCDVPCEFPQHDWRMTTTRHRYSYVAGRPRDVAFSTAIVKVDHDTGESRTHDFGDSQVPGEPIFVPRPGANAEDDGWLLTIVYSSIERRSRLVILDARGPDADPVAEARLRHHVPFGFHGTFTNRLAAPTTG